MGIELFTEITTEQYLTELEAESEKYQGLYVDMNNAEERKYVKDKASLVNNLLKRLDRARIDKSKAYKVRIEDEAARIKERLIEVNRPFTLLIDEYKIERQKVLDAEKAKRDAEALKVQIELDHEEAIIYNKAFDIDKAEREAERKRYEEQLKKEAAEEATRKAQMEAQRQAEELERQRLQKEAAERAEEQRRINDKEHRREINSRAVKDLISTGMELEEAKGVIAAIAKGLISNVSINY